MRHIHYAIYDAQNCFPGIEEPTMTIVTIYTMKPGRYVLTSVRAHARPDLTSKLTNATNVMICKLLIMDFREIQNNATSMDDGRTRVKLKMLKTNLVRLKMIWRDSWNPLREH